VDYIAALRRRTAIAAEIDAWLRGFDAVVTYGPLHTPPLLGVEPEMTDYTVHTMLTPFNLSGHPALCQCIGFTEAGLPLCWQMAANRDAEGVLLALAKAYEAATPWRNRRPEL
jgi:aspartyl-tRNA(Asn)/glutamyl-tRNA(Gln) amidotransferase subunit A